MEASQQTMEQIGKMEVQIENAIATVENEKAKECLRKAKKCIELAKESQWSANCVYLQIRSAQAWCLEAMAAVGVA